MNSYWFDRLQNCSTLLRFYVIEVWNLKHSSSLWSGIWGLVWYCVWVTGIRYWRCSVFEFSIRIQYWWFSIRIRYWWFSIRIRYSTLGIDFLRKPNEKVLWIPNMNFMRIPNMRNLRIPNVKFGIWIQYRCSVLIFGIGTWQGYQIKLDLNTKNEDSVFGFRLGIRYLRFWWEYWIFECNVDTKCEEKTIPSFGFDI